MYPRPAITCIIVFCMMCSGEDIGTWFRWGECKESEEGEERG